MGFDGEEYAFDTHADAARFIRTLQQTMTEAIPTTIWSIQSEQLRSTVRNHINVLGHDVEDEEFMYGLLYGALLTINLQAQSTEISIPTIMLMTVLLDMLEDPTGLTHDDLSHVKNLVDGPETPRSFFARLVQAIVTALS
jgi:hypothetical protein